MSLPIAGIAAGTRLLARKGEKPVETLAAADSLVGMSRRDGKFALKSQPVAIAWVEGPPVRAVRILAGAVGHGVPARDLVVLPGQPVLIGEALIPARLLVNGATILRLPATPGHFATVTLPQPALLMAEGLYLASAGVRPDQTGHAILRGGAGVVSARDALLSRARAIGFTQSKECGLRLLSCGQSFAPSVLDAVTFRFTLPGPATEPWLLSRSVIPKERLPDSGDTRCLGVMVEHITMDRAPLDLEHAALTTGWYPKEQDARSSWRWIDGRAALPAGFRSLTLHVPFTETYWIDPAGQPIAPIIDLTADDDGTEADIVVVNPQAEADLAAIRDSGLVDVAWYRREYPDVVALDIDPVWHFADRGWAEGRNPNAYFDVAWYTGQNRAAIPNGSNPLLHYIRMGEQAGRQPAITFDPSWYAATHALPADASALRHFLAHRHTTQFSPNPDFDLAYYLWTSRDMPGSDLDPFEHYLAQGYKEGRNPSPAFETAFYARRYAGNIGGEHPFLHFLRNRDRMTLQSNVRDGVRHDVGAAAQAGQRLFCFPFIWYLGNWTGYETLLAYAGATDLPHDFCIVWKNERLVHAGDPASLQTEALKAYRYEADSDEFIVQKMAYFFDDPRYLRRDARPVVLFELPEATLDANLAIARWSGLFQANHKQAPLFVMTDRTL